MSSESVWVFAYGSLIWNPGFEFRRLYVGHIKGYSRRFYQGSDEHRGSPQKLGRVATLVEDEDGSTWGLAFLIEDEQTALEYLKQRESSIGGYTTIMTDFYPKDRKEKSFKTLVYIALPENRLFLGASPMPKIAQDIALAKGSCGYNVEYLSKLIAFMKIELPHIPDDHLLNLEYEVKSILERENPQLLRFFKEALDSWLSNNIFSKAIQSDADNCLDEIIKPMIDLKFIDSVPDNHLRCMTKF